MDCASFEQRLARLMGEPAPEASHSGELGALRQHAEQCPECGGTLDLLDLLGSPPGQRDLVEEPGQEYWSDFDSRLRDRIEGNSARRGRSATGWIAATAAGLLVASLAGWWSFRQGVGVPEVEEGPVVEHAAPRLAELPAALSDGIREVASGEVLAQVDDLAGWGSPWGVDDDWEAVGPAWDRDDLFPDTSELDADARGELLAWLRDQSS